MKKLICLLAALALIFCFTACGGSDAPETKPAENNTPVAPAEPGFTFTYNGTQIALKADAAPILAALGEPKSYTEETSCAFEGLDKTYYFGSFYLQTYPQGDKDYVFGFWFADDSVSTNENIYIGAPQAQVEAAYGADSYNGTNAYILTKGETKLTVILTDGVVSSIQYDALFD